jgi:hypothetical protein
VSGYPPADGTEGKRHEADAAGAVKRGRIHAETPGHEQKIECTTSEAETALHMDVFRERLCRSAR